MRRMIEPSFGKMPTTSARRFTSLFRRSSEFVTGMTVAVPSDPAAVFQPRRMVRPSGTGGTGSTQVRAGRSIR